jgi:hypothetical protein
MFEPSAGAGEPRRGFGCMAEHGQQESCDVAVTELFVDGGFAQV